MSPDELEVWGNFQGWKFIGLCVLTVALPIASGCCFGVSGADWVEGYPLLGMVIIDSIFAWVSLTKYQRELMRLARRNEFERETR